MVDYMWYLSSSPVGVVRSPAALTSATSMNEVAQWLAPSEGSPPRCDSDNTLHVDVV